jgi:hypothetical protein
MRILVREIALILPNKSATHTRLYKQIISVVMCIIVIACETGCCSPTKRQTIKCDNGTSCFPNGFISYHGFWKDPNKYIPWAFIQHTWPLYKSDVSSQFVDIRNRLHARGIRLLVHTKLLYWTQPDPTFNQPGVSFPTPTSNESSDPANWGDIQKWRDILDTAKAAGLEVYLVMLLPEEHPKEQEDISYYTKDPKILDSFYARNNISLASNVYNYWTDFFDGVLGTYDKDGQRRSDNLMYLDMMGDFSPGADFQLNWFQALWPNFYHWFTYIDSSKKVFEIEGNSDALNPATEIADEITITRKAISENGWPEPSKYAFEAYARWSWVGSDTSYDLQYHDMINQAAVAAGGTNKIIVEELGVDHCPESSTNDGAEGLHAFSAFFGAAENMGLTDIPVGIWEYQDGPSCDYSIKFGLIKNDGTLAQGEWVIPWYFGRD